MCELEDCNKVATNGRFACEEYKYLEGIQEMSNENLISTVLPEEENSEFYHTCI